MNLLTAADLASMRATATDALDGTAVIQTQQFVSDGGGGGTTTWTASGTVACRIAPYTQSSGEVVEGDRIAEDAEIVATFPANTSIDEDAQFLSGGKTYSVVAVRERSQELTRRVAAKEIT